MKFGNGSSAAAISARSRLSSSAASDASIEARSSAASAAARFVRGAMGRSFMFILRYYISIFFSPDRYACGSFWKARLQPCPQK